MRAAAVVMALVAVALGGLCFYKGGTPLLTEGLKGGARSMVQLVPLLAVVFLLTGFAEVLLPKEVVSAWLSDEAGPRGLLVALAAGVLTPGGGPIGLPLAAALLRAGAGSGVLVTYLTSMSLLSFVRVPMEIGIYGLRLTVLRIASCALLPLAAGGIAQLLTRVVGGP
jgi:uncharacterized membrane protein YraQ (UPF0718 family)